MFKLNLSKVALNNNINKNFDIFISYQPDKTMMVDIDVRVSSHLKEELAWAADKWLWVINTITLFKNSYGIIFIAPSF